MRVVPLHTIVIIIRQDMGTGLGGGIAGLPNTFTQQQAPVGNTGMTGGPAPYKGTPTGQTYIP